MARNLKSSPADGPHGATQLPSVIVTSYNLEARDEDGFVGDRARRGVLFERLEELRRFAILVRVRGDPGDDALDRFLDAGYAVEQAERVHWITHQGKPTGSRQGLKFVFWGVPLLLAAGIAVLVQAAVGEILNCLTTVAFISVTMASFVYRRRDRLRRVSR